MRVQSIKYISKASNARTMQPRDIVQADDAYILTPSFCAAPTAPLPQLVLLHIVGYPRLARATLIRITFTASRKARTVISLAPAAAAGAARESVGTVAAARTVLRAKSQPSTTTATRCVCAGAVVIAWGGSVDERFQRFCCRNPPLLPCLELLASAPLNASMDGLIRQRAAACARARTRGTWVLLLFTCL